MSLPTFSRLGVASLLTPFLIGLVPLACSTGGGSPEYRDEEEVRTTSRGDDDGDEEDDAGSGGAPMVEEICEGAIALGGSEGESLGLLKEEDEVRIMPFGDSITAAAPWRALLSEQLNSEGFKTRFVGSVGGTHEGHGGFLASDAETLEGLLGEDGEPGWAEENPADVVLFMWGTNDAWNGRRSSLVLDGYTEMVAGLRAANPDVILLVAQIFPMSPDSTTCEECSVCSNCMTRVEGLNDEIPQWASCLTTKESPIYVVDHFTGFDVDSDTSDRVHPNKSGAAKQADNWFRALSKLY